MEKSYGLAEGLGRWLEIEMAWQKASPILGSDPNEYRRDAAGNLIQKSKYGNRQHPFGWELDHFYIPKSLGGSDASWNIQPLQWEANVKKSDSLAAVAALFGSQKPKLAPEFQNLGGLSSLAQKPSHGFTFGQY